MRSMTIQLGRQGVLTLPAELQQRYNLGEGALFTLIDLGDGSFILTPRPSQVQAAGDQVGQALAEAGLTLDDMFDALDAEREQYYQEHFGGSGSLSR